jgi:hypothetical protein
MVEPKDKRVAPREPVHFVAELELGGERLGCGVSRNASGNGLLLMTHLEPAIGTRLVLHVYVPGEDEARVLEASVVRSEKIPASEGLVWPYRVAVHLEAPPDDLQQIIDRLSKRADTEKPTANVPI